MKTEQQILKELIKAKNFVTSSDLAFSLGVSDRTIRKYLNILKEEITDSGAELEIKPRTGCLLKIDDKNKFTLFCQKFFRDDLLEDPDIRRSYILMRLISQPGFTDSYELAEDTALSPSHLRATIHDLTPTLEKYNLKLKHSSQGWKVLGDERDVRECLSNEFRAFTVLRDAVMNREFSIDQQTEIHRIIAESLQRYRIAIANSSVNSLTLHTLIAINRMETRNPIAIEHTQPVLSLMATPEYFAAQLIASSIQEKLSIKLPQDEIIYLAIHISGKQRILGHEHLQVTVGTEAIIFYNQFLRRILQLTGEDFFDDSELRTSLLNHIVPFLHRLKGNLLIQKTELPNIKNEFPYAYDLAVTGLSIIEEKYKEELPNAEFTFFALHLQLSLEKRKMALNMQFNVAIYCEEVSTIYDILTYRLNTCFSRNINEIAFISKDRRGQTDISNFQILLNVTDDDEGAPEHTIHISPSLNEKDIAAVRLEIERLTSQYTDNVILRESLFLDIHAETREEILETMCSAVAKQLPLPDDFLDRVRSREAKASTEFDNRIAVPHPMDTSDTPAFVAVARLDKPIIWDAKQVQLVFLIASDADINEWFYKRLADLIANEKAVQELLNAKDFDAFRKIFEKI